MSDGITESTFNSEADLGAVFSTIMDTLAPETSRAEVSDGTGPAVTDAGTGGSPTPPDQAAGGDAGIPAEQPGADAGDQQLPGSGGADTSTAEVGTGSTVGTVDYATVAPKFGEISQGLEARTQAAHEKAVLGELRTEFPKYFEAISKHPRMLVGTQVPRTDGKDGTETLRDSNDAADWQGAVKQLLAQEARDRVSRRADTDRETLQVLHGAIALFQNNTDLVPGTKQFNRELADRFSELAKPYEMRVDGKLNGYSIPVQPLIDQLRTRLAAEAKAKQAAPAQAAPPATQAATPKARAPQVGITSKAGGSGGPEDFSVLFGTLGLPNLKI